MRQTYRVSPAIFAISMALAGCTLHGVPGSGGGLSKATAVSLQLPDRGKLGTQGATLLTGARLVLATSGAGSCGGASTDAATAWNNATLGGSLTQGCDYLVTVEFGSLDSSGQKLSTVYFTSLDAAQKPYAVAAASFLDKPTLALNLTMHITDAGRTAGLNVNGTTVTTPVPPGVQPTPTPGSGPLTSHPESAVTFLPMKQFNQTSDASYGTVVVDIFQHSPQIDTDPDIVTKAHETSHYIHAEIRNNMNTTGTKANGFYVPLKGAVLIREPNMRKSAVAQYVPQSLQGSRFATYITGQTGWDDAPLYVFDEWNAYVNGAEVDVDQMKANKVASTGNDLLFAPVEFSVYALAVAMAAQANDQNYMNNEPQFKAFLALNLERSFAAYQAGSTYPTIAWSAGDAYINTLRKDVGAQALRDFAVNQFGTAWTMQVLGF